MRLRPAQPLATSDIASEIRGEIEPGEFLAGRDAPGFVPFCQGTRTGERKFSLGVCALVDGHGDPERGRTAARGSRCFVLGHGFEHVRTPMVCRVGFSPVIDAARQGGCLLRKLPETKLIFA